MKFIAATLLAVMLAVPTMATAATSKICSYKNHTRTCVVTKMGTYIVHDKVVVSAPAPAPVVVEKVKVVYATPAPDLRPHFDITGKYDVNTGNFKPYNNGYALNGTLSLHPSSNTDLFLQGGLGRHNQNHYLFRPVGDYNFTTYAFGINHRFSDGFSMGASFGQKPYTMVLFLGDPTTYHQAEITATVRVF